MKKQTITILGSTGQLGSDLVHECRSRSHWEVHPFSHEQIEITNTPAVKDIIEKLQPTVLINCTAYNQVDAAQEEHTLAFSTNATAVASLARLCQKRDILLVHFSTDYVFDGKSNRPYCEEDLPHPLNIYGLSKFAGEEAVCLLHPNHCIIRTSGLYGLQQGPKGKPNFIEKIIVKVKKGEPIQVQTDLICTPTFSSELAAVVCRLLEKEAIGIFHATNTGQCSWYEFACKILEILGSPCKVTPLKSSPNPLAAPRPRYSVLDTTKLTRIGIGPMSPWQNALAAYLKQRRKALSQ